MPNQFPHTVIQCLAAIAQRHGLPVNPERLIDDYALSTAEPGLGLLLRMALDMGLKTRVDKLSWEGLLAQNGVFPILARLSNDNAVIVVGVNRTEGDGKVAIIDPLEGRAGVFLLGREQFCRRWHGDVVLLKPRHSSSDPNAATPMIG